jgi:SEC-C motif-containing protein
MNCPCGSDQPYDQCCGPLLDGKRPATSPEALMRSRYTAYVRKNFGYIVETTDPELRDLLDHEANRDWMNSSTFTALQVLSSSDNGNSGTVEFIAGYRRAGAEHSHHERSKFRKHRGRWYFREGVTVPAG